MNRCTKCNLSAGKFGVSLNTDGICNYCSYFERNKRSILNIGDRQSLLANRFARLKNKYEYDVMVGLSGGKDSTYVLSQMLKKYNLKVLAVTYDNGFLTDYARESISRTVKTLGIDHYYYKPNWSIHKNFYRFTVQKLGDPCIACSIGGYFLAIKGCYEKKIPFFIHGRTPFQMYRSLYENSNDLFLKLMNLNLTDHSFENLAKEYTAVNELMRQYIAKLADTPEEAKEITEEFFVDSSNLTKDFVPEFLAYFLFDEYEEEKIKRYLEDNIGWKRPNGDIPLGHHDCTIHDAAVHIFKKIHNVDALEAETAVMLRFGLINKRQANELIELNQPTENNIEKSLDCLCKACEFNKEDLNKNIVSLKRAEVDKFEGW